MNNHNSGPPSDSGDDNDKPPVRPLSVKPSSFDFLLNQQKRQQEAEVAAREKLLEIDDDDEESSEKPVGPRRSKAGRMIRSIFKRSRTASPTKSEAKPQTEGERLPTEPERASPEAPTPENPTTAEQIEHQAPAQEAAQPQAKEDEPETTATPMSAAVAAAAQRVAAARAQAQQKKSPPAPAVAQNTAPTPQTVNTAPTPPIVPPPPANSPPAPPSPRPANRAPASVANYLPPSVANAITMPQNRSTIEADLNGGVTGPVTAFLASNMLSKRRRKQSKAEIKEVRSDLEDAQVKQRSEVQRLNRIESSIRNRVEQQARPPAEAPKPVQQQQQEVTQRPRFETSPPAPAVIAAAEKPAPTPVVKQEKPKDTPKVTLEAPPAPPKVEKLKTVEPSKEVPRPTEIKQTQYETAARRTAELSELRQKHAQRMEQAQAEQAEAVQAVNEREYDRRHEVMDETAAAILGGPAVAPARSQQGSSSTSLPSSSALIKHPTAAKEKETEELYKQSMQAGFMIGLIVVVIGLIAYVSLSNN